MTSKRHVEIFSAGCPICQGTIDLVNIMACPSCEVTILDMNSDEVSKIAATLGIKSVPAVAVNGALVDCCDVRGINEDALRSAGIGQAAT